MPITSPLVDVHYPLLRLIARQYTRSLADAEDIVQDALVRYWRYGRDQAEDPKAYLVTCVKNAAYDFLRSKDRIAELPMAVEGFAEGPLLECPLELEERRQAVERSLALLPDEQREVLVMKLWGDLTFPAIGEILNIPANTAASRYRYALSHLKEHFEARSLQNAAG